jgi:hypothetical protein
MVLAGMVLPGMALVVGVLEVELVADDETDVGEPDSEIGCPEEGCPVGLPVTPPPGEEAEWLPCEGCRCDEGVPAVVVGFSAPPG